MLRINEMIEDFGLTTTGSAAIFANQAAFLIYQCFLIAVRALLAFCLGTVDYVFLQGTFYTILPSVDVFTIQLE